MSERRVKVLCYFCDEPFFVEHGLTHKKLQIQFMEVDDIEEDTVEIENHARGLQHSLRRHKSLSMP